MNAIEARVRDLVDEIVGWLPSGFCPETELSSFLDSLDRVELAMAIEAEFDLSVDDSEAAGWRTFADVESSIRSKSGEARP